MRPEDRVMPVIWQARVLREGNATGRNILMTELPSADIFVYCGKGGSLCCLTCLHPSTQ